MSTIESNNTHETEPQSVDLLGITDIMAAIEVRDSPLDSKVYDEILTVWFLAHDIDLSVGIYDVLQAQKQKHTEHPSVDDALKSVIDVLERTLVGQKMYYKKMAEELSKKYAGVLYVQPIRNSENTELLSSINIGQGTVPHGVFHTESGAYLSGDFKLLFNVTNIKDDVLKALIMTYRVQQETQV